MRFLLPVFALGLSTIAGCEQLAPDQSGTAKFTSLAQEVIRKALKYEPTFDRAALVEQMPNTDQSVSGTVLAQNGFGATQRVEYVVILCNLSGGWKPIFVMLDGDVILDTRKDIIRYPAKKR